MTDSAGLLLALLAEIGAPSVEAVTVSGATVTVSPPSTAMATVLTLAHATPAITFPVLLAGQRKVLIIEQDGTGSRVPTYIAGAGQTISWDTISGAAPILQTAPASVDVIELFSPDGTIVIARATTVAGTVAFTATYDVATTTIAAATAAAVATTGSTVTTPYGFTTSAQADSIPVAVNALIADNLVLRKLIVQIVKILGSAGLASGA